MNKKLIIFIILLIVSGSLGFSAYSMFGQNIISSYYVEEAKTTSNPNDCVNYYKQAIKFNENKIEAYVNLANIFSYNQMYEEANEYLKLGIDKNPDNVELHLSVMKILMEQDEVSEAIIYAKTIKSDYVREKVKLSEASIPKVSETSGMFEDIVSINVESNLPVYYKINESTYQKYEKTINLTDGFYRITFISIDENGKISSEVVHEYEVEILTAPVMFSSDEVIFEIKEQVGGVLEGEMLSKAETLDLSYQVLFDDDINTLINFRELKELSLGDISNVSNLKPLLKLKNLESVSIMKGATVGMLSELLSIEGIISVKILNSSIQYLPVNSSTITSLTLKNCFINDLTNINTYKNLEILDLQTNEIKNIDGISEIKNLMILNLAENQISNIDEIGEIISLREVNVSNNRLYEVGSVSKLTFLENVDISNNEVSSVVPFSKLRYLTKINCQSNNILTIEPLVECDSLKEIHASFNLITEMPYEEKFENLEYIDIKNY